MRLLIDAVAGAVGSGAFAVLVAVPRRYLGEAAAVGLVTGLVFGVLSRAGMDGAGAAGVAALAGSTLSEVLARVRHQPAVIFLLPGLIPLVPGVTIYHAMADLVTGRGSMAVQAAGQTFLWAAAIALGVGLAAALIRGIVPQKRA